MPPRLPTFRALRECAFLLIAASLTVADTRLAFAQGAVQWVEVEIVLDENGRATVTYQARWHTTGTMHGFYFQGEAARPTFRGGQAELPGGRRVPLSIAPAGAKRWDVVLEGGEAWGPGD